MGHAPSALTPVVATVKLRHGYGIMVRNMNPFDAAWAKLKAIPTISSLSDMGSETQHPPRGPRYDRSRSRDAGAHFREDLPDFPLAAHEDLGRHLNASMRPEAEAMHTALGMARQAGVPGSEAPKFSGGPPQHDAHERLMEALLSRYTGRGGEANPWISRVSQRGDLPHMDLAQRPPQGSGQSMLDALYASGQMEQDPYFEHLMTQQGPPDTKHPEVNVSYPASHATTPINEASRDRHWKETQQRLGEEPRVYGLPPP